jgi:hypothetical protein
MKLTDLTIVQGNIRLGVETTREELGTIEQALIFLAHDCGVGTTGEAKAKVLRRFFGAILEMGKK